MSDEQTHYYGDGHEHDAARLFHPEYAIGANPDLEDSETGEPFEAPRVLDVTHEDVERHDPADVTQPGNENFEHTADGWVGIPVGGPDVRDPSSWIGLGQTIRAVDEEDVLQAGRFVLDQAARGLSVTVTMNGPGDTGSLTVGWYSNAVDA